MPRQKSAIAPKHDPLPDKIRNRDQSLRERPEGQELSDMQKRFVYCMAFQQMNPTAAARAVGFESPSVRACQMMKWPKIQHALAEAKAEYARGSMITRKQVIDGFLEGINMGKLMSDPTAVIRGWREVGLMCGFYAPVVKKISVSHSGEVLLNKLQAMSDTELLALAEESSKTAALEGEYSEIDSPGSPEEPGDDQNDPSQ